MPQIKAFELLRKHGINTPRTGLAQDIEQALFIAENLQYPIMLKIDSPEIVHKSDIGCVSRAYDQKGLETAFISIMQNARRVTKSINGIIIQELVSGYESIVGVNHDKQFGHVIMFGSGGIMAEFMKNICFRLIPIKKSDAKDMIEETGISKLDNFRNRKIDLDSLISVLMKISDLVQNQKYNIRELDINPLFLGEISIAADARIIIE